MDLYNIKPSEFRKMVRSGEFTGQTSGVSAGYAQCNLAILPEKYAYDFLSFAQKNPKACPILEVGEVGKKALPFLGDGIDVATDIPRYRIYENGVLTGEYTDVSKFWRDDFVSFLIGCSFSFESALLEAEVPVRQIEEGKNVPMYDTNIPCASAGVFHGNMVVSMRPMTPDMAIKAAIVTSEMPRVHGAPIWFGDPEKIGISDINSPNYGEAVTIKEGEVPVFWPCGVTPQNVIMATKPEICITHSPGHMLVTDVKNVSLKY
ncbi:MAG: putative hydro-lyase [Lachnospiraceae bacterium]|nr:putative hydro-lyase [Lachnospiraceae bacterium]